MLSLGCHKLYQNKPGNTMWLKALQHNMGLGKNVKNLSGGDWGTPTSANWIGLDCLSV